jgi:hypothetical protein
MSELVAAITARPPVKAGSRSRRCPARLGAIPFTSSTNTRPATAGVALGQSGLPSQQGDREDR